jgi:hypothetical protein
MPRREYQSFQSSTALNVCHPESPRFASRAEGSSLLDCRAPALRQWWVECCAFPNPVILSAVWRRTKRIARRSRRTCCPPPVPPALRGVPSRRSVQAKLIASVILRARVLLRGPKDLSLPDCRAPALRCRGSDPVPSTTAVNLSAVRRRAKQIAA